MKLEKSREPKNLTAYFHRLTLDERKAICSALNSERYHLGTLPFAPYNVVVNMLCVLAKITATNKLWNVRRQLVRLLLKLDYHDFVDGQRESATFTMPLNDALVAKRISPSRETLERGVPIPGRPTRTVTAGYKWSLPKKDYVPDEDATVVEMMQLKSIRRGFWEITCPENQVRRVEMWLRNTCQDPFGTKSRKRGANRRR